MTSDEFDPRVLQRLDRPRRPAPPADDQIRAAMLAAFDTELDTMLDDTVLDDTVLDDTVLDDEPARPTTPRHLELVLDDAATRPEGGARRPAGPALRRWRPWFYGAVAAAVLVVIAAVVTVRSGPDSVPLDPAGRTDADALVVNQFCRVEVDPLVDDVVAFHEGTGDEMADRALRNLELLAQHYVDLAARLSPDLAAEVTTAGNELLLRAAEVRRDGVDADEMSTLAVEVADALATLPGAGNCRLTELRGPTP
jgi:hypothetical protein